MAVLGSWWYLVDGGRGGIEIQHTGSRRDGCQEWVLLMGGESRMTVAGASLRGRAMMEVRCAVKLQKLRRRRRS